MKIFTTILLSLISSSVFAASVGNFAGHWTGTGNVKDNIGFSRQCTDMQTDIQQTATSVSIKYKFVCGEVVEENDGIELQINGSQLFYSGQLYGTINDKSIHLNIKNDQVQELMDINKTSAKQMNFSENMKMGNSSMVTTGTLSL